MDNNFTVFLAHSKEDKPFVREVFYMLQLDGFSPWLDEENLVAGQNWELEIEKTIEQSQVVVAFISSSGVNRAGYLQKEISFAIDIAEQQPEGAIFVIPVCLGKSEMPRRLSHLHWLNASNEPSAIAHVYSKLQSSLLQRAYDLGILTRDQLGKMPRKPIGAKGEPIRPLQEGRYIVRGFNPNGTVYYGIAEVKLLGQSQETYEMAANIGGRITRYYGDAPKPPINSYGFPDPGLIPEPVTLRGEYEVTYVSQSWSGIYEGTWGNGGTEELVPASPFAQFSFA